MNKYERREVNPPAAPSTLSGGPVVESIHRVGSLKPSTRASEVSLERKKCWAQFRFRRRVSLTLSKLTEQYHIYLYILNIYTCIQIERRL